MKWNKKVAFSILFIIMICIQFTAPVLAMSDDYTLDGTLRVPIPETYSLKKEIFNMGSYEGTKISLKNAEDLFINKQGLLFVADTGNNRVVKMTRSGEVLGVFTGPKDKPLNNPRGVYADEKGNMYVADTGNKRIVHLDYKGNFVEQIVKPETEMLGSTFTFDPSKVVVGPTGYIYAVKGQSIMTIDAYNNFRGYVGQSAIGFNLTDFLLRIFASEQQKIVVQKRLAAPYLNIALDKNGLIYATSLDMSEGEIKKLNSVGKNIFKTYGQDSSESSLINLDFLTKMNLTDKTFIFGERKDEKGKAIKPSFADIAVDEQGIVSVIEEQTGKVYQYDQDGNLLTAFGGMGDRKGSFKAPVSIVTDDEGMIYVLDKNLNGVLVFEPTLFIKTIHQAVNLYYNGKYPEAYNSWMDVLRTDENYQLAHQGLARVLFKQEKWKEAMVEYRLAEDRAGYSKAFTEYRHEIFRQNFALVLILVLAAILVLFAIFKLIKRLAEDAMEEFRSYMPRRTRFSNMLKFSLSVLFHPRETFERIKSSRGSLSVLPGIVILVAVVFTRIFYLYMVHYPLAEMDQRDANLWLEIIKYIVPVATWILASYAITSILNGESKMDEIFTASCFCMVPYIVIGIPLALISNVLSRGEAGLFAVILNGTWIWILLLLFLSLVTLNDYKIGTASVVTAISSGTMVLTWAVIVLGFVLVGQLYQFVSGILREFQMIFS